MNEMLGRIIKYRDILRKRTEIVPEVALTLGSGLGGFASEIDVEAVVPYNELPGFPVPTVNGHAGRFIFGKLGRVPVAVMDGRVHYYEGYSADEAVLPVRVMAALGTKILLLTNAAGGINKEYKPGEFMLITDHISSLMPSPLRGENIDEFGVRFPDMSEVYDKKLRETARKAAVSEKIRLHEGIYIQTPGPQYETPAEIRLYRMWGADAVGMSTVIEAEAAHHMGVRVCAVSCISNMAAGILERPLTHEEVKETGARAGADFSRLVRHIISDL